MKKKLIYLFGLCSLTPFAYADIEFRTINNLTGDAGTAGSWPVGCYGPSASTQLKTNDGNLPSALTVTSTWNPSALEQKVSGYGNTGSYQFTYGSYTIGQRITSTGAWTQWYGLGFTCWSPGTHSVTSTISNVQGTTLTGSSTHTESFNCIANSPPNAVGNSYNGTTGTTASGNVLSNDSNSESCQTLTVVSDTCPFTISSSGTFSTTYPSDNSPISCGYTMTDGVTNRTATISVTGVSPNTAPVATNDNYNGTSGSTATGNVLLNDTDTDGDTLAVSSNTCSFTLNTNGSFSTVFPIAGSPESCSYTVSDGEGGTDAGTITLTGELADTDGDGTPDATDTDDDGDGVNDSDELLVGTDPKDPETTDGTPDGSLDSDGDGLSNATESDASLNTPTDDDGVAGNDIVTANTAPAVSNPSDTTTTGGGTGTFTLAQLASDAEGDPLTLSNVSCSGGNGSATLNGASIDYTMPASGTTTTCTYDVSDVGSTSSGTFTLTAPATLDTDNDGTPDATDTDDDNDGLPDTVEDANQNGIQDSGETDPLNPDTDGDGLSDGVEDANQNGVQDFVTAVEGIRLIETHPLYPDTDGDGLSDGVEDANQNGTRDSGETDPLKRDTDGDSLTDGAEGIVDTDGDGLINPLDADDDSDTILTRYEDPDGDGDPTNDDTDGNGTPNYLDNDDDGDSLLTATEHPDINGDGNPADAQDSDNDGTPDYLDSQTGQTTILLNTRVWLQGASHPTGMIDKLRAAGLLPTQEPYSEAIPKPFSEHQGGETLAAALLTTEGMSAPVDWVMIELRDAIDPAQVLASQAAIVLRDSRVVDAASGANDLEFEIPAGNYQVAIRHRNHLGAMTLTAVTLSDTPVLVDFASPALMTWGQHARLISGNKAILRAGDSNHDGRIVTDGPGNDLTSLLTSVLSAPGNDAFNVNYIINGYQNSDLSLDGQSIFSGIRNDSNLALGNILLHPENSVMNGNHIITEQIPQEP